MMLELYVFDINLNRIGIIDTFEELEVEQHYTKHSELYLQVEGTQENARLLIGDDIRILVRSDDLNRGYIISVLDYEDSSKLNIDIIAMSMSIMMNWRTVEGQQRFSGNIEDVIKGFVNANCINPTNPKRKIPGLVLGANTGIDITTDEAFVGKELDVLLWELCEKHEVSFEILLDHENKQFVFVTYQGVDRSAIQSERSRVIFAKSFDNVVKQNYMDDISNLKTTAYIAGEGENIERVVALIGDEHEGFYRREVYFDARDLQSNYNENGDEVTIPADEYMELLEKRGENRLVDYQHIRTFTSDIDFYTQFKYREHYFLGDRVSNRNDELGIINHARVVSVYETFNKDGYELKIDFGTAIPKLIDKLKREVK